MVKTLCTLLPIKIYTNSIKLQYFYCKITNIIVNNKKQVQAYGDITLEQKTEIQGIAGKGIPNKKHPNDEFTKPVTLREHVVPLPV
ncbi:hypothetical protein BV378_18580 [Nostoc sp. RF31YmG]|nr:hypothetical protein BV378_18580 [Nostoc sp. RF31YmG]OUL29828.1 hypothetical protein BV375_15205 [Nostoc sp. 106C]